MEEQLSSFNLNYSRIEGVLCNDFKHYKIKDYIEEGSKRHQGTIGCFLAHKNCLEEISRTKEENNIILEDDVIIKKEIFEEIKKIEFPKDCEIMFINAALQSKKRPSPDKQYLVGRNTYKIYTTYPFFLGAFFYIINHKTSNKILKIINELKEYEDYDSFLYKNFNCYTYITDKVSIKDFESDRDPDATYNKFRKKG